MAYDAKPIYLCLQPQTQLAKSCTVYQHIVAGELLWSDSPIEPLHVLQTQTDAIETEQRIVLHASEQFDAERVLIYEGCNYLAGDERKISCWQQAQSLFLTVQGLGSLRITDDGVVQCEELQTPLNSHLLLETVLGPGLILALALRGIFCLHSSAARIDGSNCLFLGYSGAGKSTLAGLDDTCWQRIADDILPVSIHQHNDIKAADIKADIKASEINMHPHFPQLKLSAQQQYPHSAASALPIDQVYLLKPSASTGQQDVFSQELNHQERLLTVVQHTVASKLFSKALMRKHLQFAAASASLLTIKTLHFQQQINSLPQLKTLIRQQVYNA